jgi:hypothetical protein
MTDLWESGDIDAPFLTPTLDGGERLASRPGLLCRLRLLDTLISHRRIERNSAVHPFLMSVFVCPLGEAET